MTKLSFDFEMICNNGCIGEIKEEDELVNISDKKFSRKFVCQDCGSIVYVILDTSMRSGTLTAVFLKQN